MRPLFTSLLLLLTLHLAAACDAPTDPPESVREMLPPLTDLAPLQPALTTYDLDTTPQALHTLGDALADLRVEPHLRVEVRAALARAALDLWLHARMLSTRATVASKASDALPLREEAEQWREHLDIALARARLLTPADPTRDRGDPLALRIRALVRPLLEEERHQSTARAALLILDAADLRDTRAISHARLAQLYRSPSDIPLALQAHALLADQALTALAKLPTDSIHERPLRLAAALPQICRDGVAALSTAVTPREALDALARHCAFACSPTVEPGAETPYQPRLEPEAHTTCTGEKMGLEPGLRGAYLSFHNHLALASLRELERLRTRLAPPPDATPFSPLVAPHAMQLAQALETLTLVGSLPFFEPRGPHRLTLPSLHFADTALAPSPAVAVVHNRKLHLAAWPTWRLENGRPTPLLDSSYGFPGRPVAELDSDPSAARAQVEPAIAEIRAMPWPEVQQKGERALPLVIDVETPVEDLMRAARILARSGVTTLELVVWPDDDAVLLRFPEVVSIPLKLTPPEPWMPRLSIADRDLGGTFLVDSRGGKIRRYTVPLLTVERYLPDIYEVVLRFALSHPGLSGLVVHPHPSLSMGLFVRTLDALRYKRDGDTQPSTQHLLEAPPSEGFSGRPEPLFGELYLALDP